MVSFYKGVGLSSLKRIMYIFNTLTRQKEKFEPIEEGKVKIYACGPTVYNYFHLGNARPFITFDTLRRYLEYKGYEVTFVQNFTDIDDKMITRAQEDGITVRALADKYIEEYYKDARGLNIEEASYHPRATETIDEIVRFVGELVDKGFAYVGNDGVYFSVEKFPEYTKLSHYDLDELIQNARKEINKDSGKKDQVDFVLWKFKKEGEPAWPSPWGEGRPGWHIECSAMARKYLGQTIDIHCGGQDLIFPHHENEIAQSEAANGKPFVHYWMHNGFITVNHSKMSKSEGNFFTVREISEKVGYMPIRLFILSSHYRSPINYSLDLVEQAGRAYERIETCWKNMQFLLDNNPDAVDEEQREALSNLVRQKQADFDEAMDDDLNTAEAMGVLFELVRELNTAMQNFKDYQAFKEAQDVLGKLLNVLGLNVSQEDQVPQEVLDLVQARQDAKKNKDYASADRIRDRIEQAGYKVMDTAQGPQLEKLS